MDADLSEQFCKWLNAIQSSVDLRLPTEREWLLAAAPDNKLLDDYLNSLQGEKKPTTRLHFSSDKPRMVHEGESPDCGFYNLFGNVWEPCEESTGQIVWLGGSYASTFRDFLRPAAQICLLPFLRRLSRPVANSCMVECHPAGYTLAMHPQMKW
jgi:hypothetical protein